MPSPAWPAPPPAPGPWDPGARLEAEVAILGAGIHGAALARELALRGCSCVLVDRGAVGGGTSQWSSKLLHGGIRYLLTGDLAQMRAGLKERATWARIAPHRCRWEAFWMPHRNRPEGLAHRLGIGLYDRWGRERPGWPEGLALGPVPASVFRADPRSAGGPFRGATAYADLLAWDGALTRDLAAASGAPVLDFHEVEGFTTGPEGLREARLRDRRDGTPRLLRARAWVCALGPWTDGALATWFGQAPPRLRLSAGLHLWLPALPGCERPWALRRGGGRVLFVIPRDGRLLVGTTEREVAEGWVPPVPAEAEELLRALEAAMPGIPWRELPVLGRELGVRPLVAGTGHTARLSREARLEPHPALPNLTLVLGGKLTTARALMDRLATRLTGRPCPESATKPVPSAPDP